MTDIIVKVLQQPQIVVQVTAPRPNISLGIPGPPGPGVPIAQGVAGANISVHKLLVMINGLLYQADPTNAAHTKLIVGVSMQSAASGNTVNYTINGQVPAGSFVQGSVYFAGLNGSLSTSPIALGAAWMKQVGIGQSSAVLLVEMGPTVAL